MPAIYGYDDVGNHAMMLVDAVRMRAFAEAIRLAVRPGDVVVDVGSGTGVLALLAAKAGARRVYAIERTSMARMIESAAARNGVADIVRVVRGDARDMAFVDDEAGKPTLLVSEMIGSFGIDEDYLGLLGAVRARCAPGCRVLPASVSLRVALAWLPALASEIDTVRAGVGVRLDDVAESLLSRPSLAWVRADELLSSPTPLQQFSVGDAVPRSVGGRCVARRAGSANAIVAWFESELVPGISLSSAPGDAPTHWANVILPLDPTVEVAAGDEVELEVKPRVPTDRGTWSWGLRVCGHTRRGDAMKSLVGTKDDFLRRFGSRATPPDPSASAPLVRLATAMGGRVEALAVMAARLRASYPERYVDDADAAAELERLVRAAGE